jgi:hypothetical protein
VTRWVIRYYGGRYVLLRDGHYIAESHNPIALILGASLITHQGVCRETL